MTETPSSQTPPPSPMEQQGALLGDLAGLLLRSVDLPPDWTALSAAFLPHGAGWAGRFVITAGQDAARGNDAVFAEDSAVTALLRALQEATAAQSQAVLSLRLTLRRAADDPDAVSMSADLNHDRDPGSFDGLGGVDAAVVRDLVARVGEGRVPAWALALADGP